MIFQINNCPIKANRAEDAFFRFFFEKLVQKRRVKNRKHLYFL